MPAITTVLQPARCFAIVLFALGCSGTLDDPSGSLDEHALTNPWAYCASENNRCAFSGTRDVRYGASGTFVYKTLTDGVSCSNTVFGDPLPGVAKYCEMRETNPWTFCASENDRCAFSGTRDVRYGASGTFVYKTLTDGVSCSNTVFGDPLPGVAKYCEMRAATTTTTTGSGTTSLPTTPPPTTSAGYGPKSTITCPSNSIRLPMGTNLPLASANAAAGTTFCIAAGVHKLTAPIKPKTGNVYVGEYGAILDGTGWTSSDTTMAAIRAHNEDIDNVTIRNLIIRNMPYKGIHAYRDFSSGWTIDDCEIAYNKVGFMLSDNSVVRRNRIHHNWNDPTNADTGRRGGGYAFYMASNVLFEGNEIAYNGPEQKAMNTRNITWRGNWAHHNILDGLWNDGDGAGSIFENNVSEDNGGNGIFWELSTGGIIRNNTMRRNGYNGLFLSTSKNTDVSGNVLEDNNAGITIFIDCTIVGWFAWQGDLANNYLHHNTVRVSQSGKYAAALGYVSACTAAQLAPYLSNAKNNRYDYNTYDVPAGGWWWVWGDKTLAWSGWRALPQDANGTGR